ncbi:MAG: DNA repair protein RecO [Kiritimatiellaceae bacterium]|nr:DNA repair protein RecO [Kiritimatiellaceae bacterium]|tara:strand:+ start:1214 stop:1948 length:735 start_codon:yes stop_codon:yes gene_type:complete
MIERTTAIPLAIYPYSARSHIVHWFTRHHGLLSTLLKNAQHPRSRFLGEYQLFGTSELLFYARRKEGLHTAKECALLQPRHPYRTHWRAMQTASYLTALFRQLLPENAPAPHLYHHLECLLDYTLTHHAHPLYLPWAELSITQLEGHTPQLTHCAQCNTPHPTRFDPTQGTARCNTCTPKTHTTLPLPSSLQTLINHLLQTESPHALATLPLTPALRTALHQLTAALITHTYQLHPRHRNAIAA